MNGDLGSSGDSAASARYFAGRAVVPGPVSLAVAALLTLAFAAAAWGRRWICDDAFINLRVVEMVRLGHGPVYNPGERVEVATSPLWLLLQIAWDTLLGNPALGSVVMGILFATAAVFVMARPPDAPRDRFLLPAGALVYAALPVAWDFATSGLETGFVIFWLATSWRASLRLHSTPLRWRPQHWAQLAWIGLGPLVRPEAIFPAALMLVAATLPILRSPEAVVRRARRLVACVIVALTVPVCALVARAGYFGSVVSNPSVAKGLGEADVAGGLVYVWDLISTYQLALGVAALVVLVVASRAGGRRAASAPTLALVLGALAWAAVVVRVGGDFMHGRMLLPPLFALLLPVGALTLPEAGLSPGARRAWSLAAVALLAWATCSALLLRPAVQEGPPVGIADERAYYVDLAGKRNPMSTDDYAGSFVHNSGVAVREAAERDFTSSSGRTVVLRSARAATREPSELVGPPAAEWIPENIGVVVAVQMLGILGATAGPRVFIYDVLGLADPLAARMPELENGRVGHRRRASVDWYYARYAAPSEHDTDDVRLLRQALQCGDLAELHEAITAPMTPALFVRNVLRAPRLARLSIPREPDAALARFCGSRGAT